MANRFVEKEFSVDFGKSDPGGRRMSGARIELDARLDLRAVEPLAQAILEHAGADLVLDAAKVEHFGALSVQTIRAAAKTWATGGHGLMLENCSEDCRAQIATLGFSPETLTRWEDDT